MKTDKSMLQSRVIYNSELQSRDDLGVLVFCNDTGSTNSLARYLSDNLLKKDFELGRHRVCDQVQDPGTIIEIMTNIKDALIYTGDIIESINLIIDQGLLISAKITGAAVALDKLLEKNSKLKKPVKAILTIFKWSKKNDTDAIIESNKALLEITPQKVVHPESLLIEAIKQLSDKEDK